MFILLDLDIDFGAVTRLGLENLDDIRIAKLSSGRGIDSESEKDYVDIGRLYHGEFAFDVAVISGTDTIRHKLLISRCRKGYFLMEGDVFRFIPSPIPKRKWKRVEVRVRWNVIFVEVYLAIRNALGQVGIPYVYGDQDRIENFEDDVIYFLVGGVLYLKPKKNPNSLVINWYFEQPTSNFINQDEKNGWFDVDLLMTPWPSLCQFFSRMRPFNRIELLSYGYDSSLRGQIGPQLAIQTDVFFVGCTNLHRAKVRDSFKDTGLNILFSTDLHGSELDYQLCTAKIVLNIHYYPGACLEIHRINRALACGACVVSETSSDLEIDERYSRYIVFSTAEEMAEKCRQLIVSGEYLVYKAKSLDFSRENDMTQIFLERWFSIF